MIGVLLFSGCSTCLGLNWVCEKHNNNPWDGKCCGGAGEPCKRCNADGEKELEDFIVISDVNKDKADETK